MNNNKNMKICNCKSGKFNVKIKIRRDGREVKKEVEILDNKIFEVYIGWVCEDESQYKGEHALILPHGLPISWTACGCTIVL